jgi:hypothetical protein
MRTLPTLALAGITGGPPWTALIEGVPGHEAGVLLRQGESAGGITATRIGRDSVHLTGLDTNWVLAQRHE